MIHQVAPVIQRLARKQRRKIWLIYLLEHAYLPLGWMAMALLIAGIIHQGFVKIDLYPAVFLTCIPPVLYALLGLKKRPSLTEAVTQVDRHLKAHSLFIATWEMTISSHTHSRVRPLILGRAEKQLPQWCHQLDRQTYPRPGTPLLIAFGLTAIGGFLLILPGKPTLLMHEPVPMEARQPQSTDIPDPVALINEILLQEQNEMSAAPMHNSQDHRPDELQHEPQMSDSIAAGRQEPQQKKTESIAMLEGAHQQTDSDEPNTSVQEQSSMAERHHTGRTNGIDSPPTPFAEQVQAAPFRQQHGFEIEIHEQSETRAFNPQKGSHLSREEQGVMSDQAFTQKQPAVGSIGSQVAFRRISPEQRALVIRYFEQLSQLNESIP